MQTDSSHISFLLSKDIKIIEKKWKEIGANSTSNMVIFQILLLRFKRVISKERNTVRASNPRASLTWTDNTSKVGYALRPSSVWIYLYEAQILWYFLNPCQRRTRFSSIAIELNHSHGTFSSITIDLKGSRSILKWTENAL